MQQQFHRAGSNLFLGIKVHYPPREIVLQQRTDAQGIAFEVRHKGVYANEQTLELQQHVDRMMCYSGIASRSIHVIDHFCFVWPDQRVRDFDGRHFAGDRGFNFRDYCENVLGHIEDWARRNGYEITRGDPANRPPTHKKYYNSPERAVTDFPPPQ